MPGESLYKRLDAHLRSGQHALASCICLRSPSALIATGVLIVFLARPRAAEPDPRRRRRRSRKSQWPHPRHGEAGSQNAHRPIPTNRQRTPRRSDARPWRLDADLAKNTIEHLQKLIARLAVIDTAQKNITELATQVSSCKVFSPTNNRAARLGRANRSDHSRTAAERSLRIPSTAPEQGAARLRCALMPDGPGPLVIDAKFPLEAMTAWREAKSEEERKLASSASNRISRSTFPISQKIPASGRDPGHRADVRPIRIDLRRSARRFDDVVQSAQRAKRHDRFADAHGYVAIQVIKQVRKDADMREAADRILSEVGHLMKDVGLLSERVRNLTNASGADRSRY